MKVLGYKIKGIIPFYCFKILIGIIICFASVLSDTLYNNKMYILVIIIGILFISIEIYYMIIFIKTKDEVIKFDELNKVFIINNKEININNVTNATFHKEKIGKRTRADFGNITIKTKMGSIKCHYVSDCQEVVDEIIKLLNENEKY